MDLAVLCFWTYAISKLLSTSEVSGESRFIATFGVRLTQWVREKFKKIKWVLWLQTFWTFKNALIMKHCLYYLQGKDRCEHLALSGSCYKPTNSSPKGKLGEILKINILSNGKMSETLKLA